MPLITLLSKRLIHSFALAFLLIAASGLASAQNKVVVIPMAGDDFPPFALVAADDTNTSDYSFSNGVTLDKVTGLEWQQNDGVGDYDYVAAKTYCLNLVLDGKTDWRLPSIKELVSLVDFGSAFLPLINLTAFSSSYFSYWSDTEISTSDDYRLTLEYSENGIGSSLEGVEMSRSVRCVRSNGVNSSSPALIDNKNGTVTDKATGLTWQQQTINAVRSHANAIQYCQDLSLGGSSNWRLPEIKELHTIVDYRLTSPVIDETLFPGTKTAAPYWSATDYAVVGVADHAWSLRYNLGTTSSDYLKTSTIYVRCVQ